MAVKELIVCDACHKEVEGPYSPVYYKNPMYEGDTLVVKPSINWAKLEFEYIEDGKRRRSIAHICEDCTPKVRQLLKMK